jgi:short-subunit dehydrogenase
LARASNQKIANIEKTQKTKEPASIIITGSKQGITNPFSNPAYNASKSMIKAITEYLAHDLRTSNPNISVHFLIPGWIFTGLSGNSGPVPDEEAMKTKKPGAWLPSQVAEYGYKKMSEGKFSIICPDNDVTEGLDQARMTWGAGDCIEGRSALSRWDEEYKDQAAECIKGEAEKRTAKK